MKWNGMKLISVLGISQLFLLERYPFILPFADLPLGEDFNLRGVLERRWTISSASIKMS